MHSIAALPVIPLSALAGLPPAEELPTLVARRRYAFTLACALAGERSYEITTWSRKTMPLLLRLRAVQEDWPMIGTSYIVGLMQPLPLPEDPAELFARAVAGAEQGALREVLEILWGGGMPMGLAAETHACLADAIREAGLKASDEASKAAHAADPRSKRRTARAASTIG